LEIKVKELGGMTNVRNRNQRFGKLTETILLIFEAASAAR
jgi:hypothetical protein